MPLTDPPAYTTIPIPIPIQSTHIDIDTNTNTNINTNSNSNQQDTNTDTNANTNINPIISITPQDGVQTNIVPRHRQPIAHTRPKSLPAYLISRLSSLPLSAIAPTSTISAISASDSSSYFPSALNVVQPSSSSIDVPTNLRSEQRSLSAPPDYHDSVLQKRWESRQPVLPREEEGSEILPDYKCTIFKMGHVYVKREFEKPGVRSRRRGWRKLYLEVWGTVLRIYRASPKEGSIYSSSSSSPSSSPLTTCSSKSTSHWHKYYYTPITTISLAGADATRALDYTKRPNSLRLTTVNGPQYLLRLPTVTDMTLWIDSLQAAINISLDLEHRPMPKFLTMPARAHNVSNLDTRMLAIERARQQRLRDQAEVLI
ncbi:hypothetical protein J3Q64DRAFT_1635154 [Phycomyces blakesleeanus]|uniref:PH domain-containing protein n=1 Tax=Phycomyces blakesleeanus TaxID=4837 RepID=A0ABR3B644_PHYBL